MKKLLLFLGLGFSLIFIILFICTKVNIASVSDDTTQRLFIVNKSDGIITIARELKSKKFIKSEYAFIIYTTLYGKRGNLQSGTYRLSSSLSTPEIVDKLSSGGVSDYWLKIIEGSRIEEIASLFPEDDIPFTGQDFLKQTRNQEGYVFPDSYLIPQYFTLDQTLEVISKNFDQKFKQAKENKQNTGLTDKQSLILASLLEREGRSLESKKMIAGILLNRLNIGMALQLDATIQYARDSQQKNINKYWQPITKSDLQINSSYNTYENPGLPPGPICNPGYDSLYAAFHPTDSDYMYYITGSDGQMHYSKTLDEHNENIAKYLK